MGKDTSKVTFPISDIHLHFLPYFLEAGRDSIAHFNSQFAWENHLVLFKCELSPASLIFELIPTQVTNSGEATERPQGGAWLVEMYY